MDELTHINEDGKPKMVDVGQKEDTLRSAEAYGCIYMKENTLEMIMEGKHKKGDVISTAQVAGIMAAKKTWEMIPMCHNILINGIDMKFEFDIEKKCVYIRAIANTIGKTGIEMEVLTAVSVAALTIYDMCKSVDRSMEITNIKLMKKTGGKSGEFIRGDVMKGKVIAVNISEKKGVTKTPMEEGNFIEEFGLEGDAHAGKWHRQVSLLGNESVQKMEEMLKKNGFDDCRGIFAENLTTEGIILYKLPVGTKMKIGPTLMEITQIGKECHDGCAIKKTVGKCVMPLEGIFTRVLTGGIIKPGDEIEIISS